MRDEQATLDLERQRAYIVWAALERAADHLSPGNPAEVFIRRALIEAEVYWRTLSKQRRDDQRPEARRNLSS